VENDGPPSFPGAPQQTTLGRSQPDGWDSARFWALFLNFGTPRSGSPFPSPFLASRPLQGAPQPVTPAISLPLAFPRLEIIIVP